VLVGPAMCVPTWPVTAELSTPQKAPVAAVYSLTLRWGAARRDTDVREIEPDTV
jgi:hypothetical protein